MTPIRPTALTPTSTAGPSQEAARLAAQKAFFALAFGQAAAEDRAAALPSAPASAITAAPFAAAPAATGPQKLPRPGSILDIRV